MEKRLQNLPVFNRQELETTASSWRSLSSGPGTDRTVIEWSISAGPRCFIYPAANRSVGRNLLSSMLISSTDERYADWLEYEYLPNVVDALKALGQHPQVICTDQRPIQVMRAKRRTQAAAGLAKVAMGGSPKTH